MISHIRGEIAHRGDGFVVIDVNGVGYQVNVTKPVLQELSGKDRVKLYTYLNVREDALNLYGFTSANELEMFKLLIGVTRIGPQIALNILSQIRIEELAAAIMNEDEKVLTNISGVGKKNASRMILELKDRIRKKMEDYKGIPSASFDAVSALVGLGFQRREAHEAVMEAAQGMKDAGVQALIKAALVRLKEK